MSQRPPAHLLHSLLRGLWPQLPLPAASSVHHAGPWLRNRTDESVLKAAEAAQIQACWYPRSFSCKEVLAANLSAAHHLPLPSCSPVRSGRWS